MILKTIKLWWHLFCLRNGPVNNVLKIKNFRTWVELQAAGSNVGISPEWGATHYSTLCAYLHDVYGGIWTYDLRDVVKWVSFDQILGTHILAPDWCYHFCVWERDTFAPSWGVGREEALFYLTILQESQAYLWIA